MELRALQKIRDMRLIDLWKQTIAILEAKPTRTPDEEQELTFARRRLEALHRERMAMAREE